MELPIEYLNKNSDDLKAVSVFLSLKRAFVNSRYYDWSVSYVSRKSGMSKHMVKKWIKEFIDRGWVKERDGALIFWSYKKIFGKAHKKRRVQVSFENHVDLLKKLRFIVMSENIKSFKWLQQCSEDLRNKTCPEKKQRAIARKFTKKNYRDVSAAQEHYKVSYKGLGKEFGISSSSAFRMVSKFIEEGKLLRVTSVKKLSVHKGAFNDCKDLLPKGSFISPSGDILVRECNQYVVL